MSDVATTALLQIALFSGAFVSGLAGFAFSGVAGVILLRLLDPLEAVPLMMASSMIVQAMTYWSLRKTVKWCGNIRLIVGGLFGSAIAVFALQHVSPASFRIGFGVTVAVYAAAMLLRPAASSPNVEIKPVGTMLIGFGGGLVGGLTAMPGIIPTIWCDVRGLPRRDQRAMVQPYITTMQLVALALITERNGIPAKVWIDLGLSIPAVAVGAAVGLAAFGRLGEHWFRKIILCVLLFSGLLLAI